MRVSTKSDYALRALMVLAQAEGATAVSAEEMGRQQDIPSNFLQTILADLRRAGIVQSRRGPAGGWRLARPPAEVTVADVIRAVDGPLVSIYGLRPESVAYEGEAEILQPVWIAARSALREIFESVTIAALVTGDLPDVVRSRIEDEAAWR